MRRLLPVMLFVLGLGILSLAPGASAQEGYEPTVTVCVDVNAATVDAEGRVTLIGPPRCAPPGVVVDIHIDDSLITQTTALEDGSFTTTFAIPSGTRTGRHQLVVRIGNEEMVVPLVVTPAAARSEAPETGNMAMTLMVVLVALATLAAAGFFGWKRLPVSARRRSADGDQGLSRIDTTHFVPQRRELAGTGAERREEETSG